MVFLLSLLFLTWCSLKRPERSCGRPPQPLLSSRGIFAQRTRPICAPSRFTVRLAGAARHCLLAAGTLRGDTYMLIIARCTPTSFVRADYALNLRPWNWARVAFCSFIFLLLPFLLRSPHPPLVLCGGNPLVSFIWCHFNETWQETKSPFVGSLYGAFNEKRREIKIEVASEMSSR